MIIVFLLTLAGWVPGVIAALIILNTKIIIHHLVCTFGHA